jgi:hypothetical protein
MDMQFIAAVTLLGMVILFFHANKPVLNNIVADKRRTMQMYQMLLANKPEINNMAADSGAGLTAVRASGAVAAGEKGKLQVVIAAAIIAYTKQKIINDRLIPVDLIEPSAAWKAAGISQVMQARF